MKDRGTRDPGRKYVLVYFEQENHYTRCDSRKVVHDSENQDLRNLIGSLVTVEDLSGKHVGLLKAVGKEQAMKDLEEELELEAMNRSMEIHGDCGDDDGTQVSHAVICWLKDLKHSRVSLGRVLYDKQKYKREFEIVGGVFQTKRRGNTYCDAVVRAVGTEEEMTHQLNFWESLGTAGSLDLDLQYGSAKDDFELQAPASKCLAADSMNCSGLGMAAFSSGMAHNIVAKRRKPIETGKDDDGECQNVVLRKQKKIYGNDNVDVSTGAIALIQAPSNLMSSQRIAQLEADLRAAKLEVQKWRSKARRLQKLSREPVGAIGRLTQVGAGLSVTESQLDDLLSYKEQPCLYLSYLNRYTGAFSTKVMSQSSVRGVRTVTSPSEGPRPPLDEQKLAALTAFTIQRCEIGNHATKIRELRSKMSNMCSNARKKDKRDDARLAQCVPTHEVPDPVIE